MAKATEMEALGRRARVAARRLLETSSQERADALLAMADALEFHLQLILDENQRDLDAAEERGITGAMHDRLRLTPDRVGGMSTGLREVAAMADPLGQVVAEWTRPNGLHISQVRIPLGVIGIIYEARPNVTADAAGLCLKSGNVVFLRGGSEAQHSNHALLKVLRAAIQSQGLPEDAIMSLPSTDRSWIMEMMKADQFIDVIIPRGGESLIRFVVENSRVPVIKHYKGVCHVYIDGEADLDKAFAICVNAKVQRPGVCNAMETLLVDRKVAEGFLPEMAQRYREAGVELRGCDETRNIIETLEATELDYHAEYLDLVLSIKVVSGVDGAIAHIEEFGSDHTESIISENSDTVQRFLEQIQSSVVMANASTRFSDGGQMGLGAEIGISTSKLHAYGPMGVTDLTTRKFVIRGDGQIRN
jgi:glutamate-5-semialdehyde dehydrogenase